MEGGDEGVNSQLKRKIQDLEAMNEVFEKNEVELKDQIKGLNTTIKVQEERHSKIVQDFEALKINSIQNGSELVKLRKIIEYEREERKKVEGDAVQLLKRIKDEFEKRNQTQKDNYEQQITSLKEQLNQTQCKTINHETDYLNKEIKEHQDRIKEVIYRHNNGHTNYHIISILVNQFKHGSEPGTSRIETRNQRNKIRFKNVSTRFKSITRTNGLFKRSKSRIER